ncbi:MAG: transporter substrate-binding domain-containing protein [Inhella sp.]
MARLPSLVLTCVLGSAGAAQAQERTLTVCVDPKPAPQGSAASATPPAAEVQPTFSMDLFILVFRRAGQPMRFVTDQPWARCLLSAERGQIDFALGGYYSDTRAQVYAFSMPYMTLTPMVFSRASRPVRPQLAADLQGLRGCGMNGASYAHYGLAAGALDTGVNRYPKLFEKLLLCRCDYVPEELEVVAGMQVNGQDILTHPQLLASPARWARGPTKHLMAAKGSAAAALLPQLDRALVQLIREGMAGELWARHVPGVPYRP